MPLTFYDIEKRKTWRIGVMFVFLVLLYFLINSAVYITVYALFFSSGKGLFPGLFHLSVLFVFSLVIAIIHFSISTFSAVQYVKKNLKAIEPDPEDGIHKSLLNILEEIHVVTGNKMKIECLVIPTLSLNALSIVDLKGSAVIAITEGLISRITRSQLEAVMAHEAYHIISGDCLETTVASTLFGIPSSFLEKIKQIYSEPTRLYDPRISVPVFFVFTFLWVLVKFSNLLNMFISREREYRADAGAVRLTRNPMALAEVLYFLSRNRGGARFIGQGLENLCLVSPTVSRLDEEEGWFSDLVSTHPPIRKRIRVLLDMARASVTELAKKFDRGKAEEKVKAEEGKPKEGLFFALDGKYMWQGPFTLFEMAALPWMSTLTWVSAQGGSVMKASEVPLMNAFFKERVNKEAENVSGLVCHTCSTPLVKKSYEKTSVLQCIFCGGLLVNDKKMPRIIARKDVKCSERIKALARAMQELNHKKGYARIDADNRAIPLLKCPECGKKMRRVFYTYTYLVEVDRCSSCGVTWFDHDELEILQCMIDNKMVQTKFDWSGPG
jgi:heat shock protein HtpX